MQLEHAPSWPGVGTPLSAPQGHSSTERTQAPVARAKCAGLCSGLHPLHFSGSYFLPREGRLEPSRDWNSDVVNQNMQLGEDISWKLFQCYENLVVLEKCLFPLEGLQTEGSLEGQYSNRINLLECRVLIQGNNTCSHRAASSIQHVLSKQCFSHCI